MPDIRYVCLSDLHLGAEASLFTALTPDNSGAEVHKPSTVMQGLVYCLAELIEKNEDPGRKPTLILCGDILEFALSIENIPAMVFERFAELVFPANGRLFSDTVYFVPGNHDHHLWETAREGQYADYIASRPSKMDLEIPWHSTRMSEDDPAPVETRYLNALLNRHDHLADIAVRAIYPNLALRSDDEARWVVFHHGHFIEGLYRLMSTLRDVVFPTYERQQAMAEPQVWDWEAENFAWIDFFWSMLGRSGEVGTSIGVLYDSLKSEKAMKKLAGNLAHGIADRTGGPAPWRWAKKRMLKLALDRVVQRVAAQERRMPTEALTPRAQKGLHVYLEGPLRNQILTEARDEQLPTDLTFVFGHTHKPLSSMRNLDGYPQAVRLYNTGGWVVDTPEPRAPQGAAAILLDENLNAVSLRLFNQTADESGYRARLERANALPDVGNPLYQRLNEMVDPEGQPWRDFAESSSRVVKERRAKLNRELADLSS